MLRLGLLGCGRIGRVHADSLAAHPRAELAVAYDPFEASAREVVAHPAGSPPPTREWSSTTPPSTRSSSPRRPRRTSTCSRAAVRAGKAVLCEKPIDLDLARVDACWAEIAGLRRDGMVGFNRRFDPSFRAIRDRVAAGEIGPLEQLTIISRDPAPPPAAYVATPAACSGT